MIREEGLENIYDGNFYMGEDMVPIGCNDCEGCSECCRITGDSIILDPYDMFNLCKGLKSRFEDLIEDKIEIRNVDGLILPNLMVEDENNPDKAAGCPFLNEQGRCSIHKFRPGFCRLFPLGRYYEGDDFKYILQVNECVKRDAERYPVKVSEWLEIDNLERYEEFIRSWHSFCRRIRRFISKEPEDKAEQLARYILQIFYVTPYKINKDFFNQFSERLERINF